MSVFNRLWRSLSGRSEPDAAVPLEPASLPVAVARHGPERRRLPRVRVLSALDGYGIELERKVLICEVSPGGFSVESPVEFSVGSEHTFLFSTPDGAETMVRCVCRHSRPPGAAVTSTYGAGFEFLPAQDESLYVVVRVYEELRRRGPG